MGLIKIETPIDCVMYSKYVIRDGELYIAEKLKDINPDEIFCGVVTSPSSPPDIVLYRAVKTPMYVDEEFSYPYTTLSDVTNMDYFNPFHIKNYILGIGEFKDWYDVD